MFFTQAKALNLKAGNDKYNFDVCSMYVISKRVHHTYHFRRHYASVEVMSLIHPFNKSMPLFSTQRRKVLKFAVTGLFFFSVVIISDVKCSRIPNEVYEGPTLLQWTAKVIK